MAQTKHRSIKTEQRNDMDEMEQAMHIKAHRAKKKNTFYVPDEDDVAEWELDDDLAEDVVYLLRKNK